MKHLPNSSQILPFSIPLIIPGFLNHYYPGLQTLAPCEIPCKDWFYQFAAKVIQSISRQYYPVCRMSDGEYRFLLGEQPLDKNWPWSIRIKYRLKHLFKIDAEKRITAGGFTPNGKSLYISGDYSEFEINQIKSDYTKYLCEIARTGVLALHLTHGTLQPFQQHFFPALGKWLKVNKIDLTIQNYVPFYFVYSLLRGFLKSEIIQDRRILVVHGAKGGKRKAIISSLQREGCREIFWADISSQGRSWFDRLDITPFLGSIDICFIGAGIGKAQIFNQLIPLKVPCIDAGYVFEVWANPAVAKDRAYMLPDEDPKSIERCYFSQAEHRVYQQKFYMLNTTKFNTYMHSHE